MDLGKNIRNVRALYGTEKPKQVTFAITNHCNMVCTTCSFPNVPSGKKRHVSLKDAKYAIDFLKKQGVKMISITGGEPLLHPDFIDICDHISRNNMMISYISTGGGLITEQIAKKLSTMNVNIIGLSIDVMDKNGIGVTRKANIRKTVTQAKKLLDRYKIKTYAGIVLGRHTANIKEVINTARSLGFNKIIFSYPQVEMNSSYLAARDIDKLKGDVLFWKNIVKDILNEKRWNMGLDIFNTRVNLKEFLAYFTKEGYMFECPGGKYQFYLDWDLNIYRCLNSSEMYGNLKDQKDLNFGYTHTNTHTHTPTPCSACTQQTHRDYASFYHAFQTVKDMESAIRHFEIQKLFNIIKIKENRKSLSSLIEGYLGGFI